jgi:DNA-binding GntR family transcriptional regulator
MRNGGAVNIVPRQFLGKRDAVPVHSRYLDIAAKIRQRIEDGEWEPGARLPTLDAFAAEYGANRDTIARAIAALEAEGYVWAVQGRGVTVRYGTIRPRRPRGNLVKRNATSPGYSFPSATSQEVWKHHIPPDASVQPLTDPRIARLLGVPVGSSVMRRFRVTGPESEPPFQISYSWIHPRGVEVAPEVSEQAPGPSDWIHRLEKAGHWPISWMEIHRARMPTKDEAALLEIPTNLPVLEIVRVGTSGGDGKPIEVSEYIVASDRVETIHVLHRDESARDPWPDAVEAPEPEQADAP